MEISGKAAVVVGGASGMAKATAEMLVREGARVSILAASPRRSTRRPC